MSDVERPERFDTSDPDRREDGLASCALAVRRGELVLLPTDTVYGIGCDAFDPAAVKRLLDAKGRGREMPPPVLVSNLTTLDALATDVPDWARLLTDHFWPGSLTLVLHQQSSLQWDLGDTRGTVALRMPDHDVALELIQRTGPLAVSSANVTGMPAALDAREAIGMLGDEVVAVLDSGRAPGGTASTIVDCTGHTPRVLREGAVAVERLREVLAAEGHWLEEDDDDLPGAHPALPPPVEPDPGPDGDTAEVVEGELLGDPLDDESEHERASGTHAADVVDAEVVATAETAGAGKHRAESLVLSPSALDAVPTSDPAPAAKKTPAKKTTAKKTTAKKAPAKKTPAKKTTTKKTTAKKAPAAKKTLAKKATAKKATPATTKKATTAKATTAKKAAAKKTTAKKTAGPRPRSTGSADGGPATGA